MLRNQVYRIEYWSGEIEYRNRLDALHKLEDRNVKCVVLVEE